MYCHSVDCRRQYLTSTAATLRWTLWHATVHCLATSLCWTLPLSYSRSLVSLLSLQWLLITTRCSLLAPTTDESSRFDLRRSSQQLIAIHPLPRTQRTEANLGMFQEIFKGNVRTAQARGFGGRKSPSGVQGRSPGRGSGGRSPQKLKHIVVYCNKF